MADKSKTKQNKKSTEAPSVEQDHKKAKERAIKANAMSTRGGLLSLDELNEFEYVRPEFVAPTFRAKITLEYKAFTGNSTLVRLFPESEHIQILSNSNEKRLVVWSCSPYEKGATHWSKLKNGRLQAKRASAEILCGKIFKLMNWDANNRYKVMAVYQEFPSQTLAVFNLKEAEIYKPADGVGGGQGKRKRVFPIDWENSFGTPYAEHEATYEVNINTLSIETNSKEGRAVIARVPTAGEIITREYYTPDEIMAGGVDNGTSSDTDVAGNIFGSHPNRK